LLGYLVLTKFWIKGFSLLITYLFEFKFSFQL